MGHTPSYMMLYTECIMIYVLYIYIIINHLLSDMHIHPTITAGDLRQLLRRALYGAFGSASGSLAIAAADAGSVARHRWGLVAWTPKQ